MYKVSNWQWDNVLGAIINGMQAVKLCSKKIFQFLTKGAS